MTLDTSNKTIARNTLLLYFRMLLTVAVSLYTVRIVLETLGETDYGIYNVVGGMVALFSFLSSAMTSASQRFFSFELGNENMVKLKRVFNATLAIYLVIGLVVLLLSETVGIWFLRRYMTIPDDRMIAVIWVYRFSVLSFMMTIFTIPYNSLIVAHERMELYAYVSIVEVILKLLIVYVLVVVSFDKLKLYSVLNFFTTTIVTFIYRSYCIRNFRESRLSLIWDKNVFKEIISYSSWNLVGNLAVVLREQGTNILLNIFFSPTVNAARAVAFQVGAVLNTFVTNFQMALNPQIVKTYASQDWESFALLINKGTRYSYYLLLLLSLPFLLGTDYVLTIWLKSVPNHTVNFVRLILVISLIDSLYRPILTGHLATGKIKLLQIVVGGVNLLLLPICYYLLRRGLIPETVFIVGVFFSIVGLILRLVLFKKVFPSFSINIFLRKVILNSFVVTSFALIGPVLFIRFQEINTFFSFMMLGISCLGSGLLIIFFIGLDSLEREWVKNKSLTFLKGI